MKPKAINSNEKNDKFHAGGMSPSPTVREVIADKTESKPTFRSMMSASAYQSHTSLLGSDSGWSRKIDPDRFISSSTTSRSSKNASTASTMPLQTPREHEWVQSSMELKTKPTQVSQIESPPAPAPTPTLHFNPVSISSCWENARAALLPKMYKLECSNRILDSDEHPFAVITTNLSTCFRALSMQAKYFENPAQAALLTLEQVVIYVYLWKTGGGKQTCVEVQRISGDSYTFHRYARQILDAAVGDFDPTDFKDYCDSRYLHAAARLLKTELTEAQDQAQESLMAVELAAGLIMETRLDSRVLGLESLCILTDVTKMNPNTALLASNIVLFGHEEPLLSKVHKLVLNLVQHKNMGDDAEFLNNMVVEYDSDDEDFFCDDELKDETKPPEYLQTIKTLLNLALTALANSWEVLIMFDSFDSEPEITHEKHSSLDLSVARFRLAASEHTHLDILASLLAELGSVEKHPHNACLAAKCLRIMCQYSPHARERTKELMGEQYASRAEEVGLRSHLRLERECGNLLRVLEVSE